MTVSPLHQSSAEIVIDAAEAARRVVEPADFVADTAAFVDVRLPRSAGKASYSFIGPGVSQNADQFVNLDEPHGFCVGAASMPHGVVNNPHLHYTAEVFICTRGQWRIGVGQYGEQTLDIGPGTVFSAPTWVFRGFENVGDDDGWLFAVLGGDDTGGVIWAPDVLRQAAQTGLYLASDYSVIDTEGSDPGQDTVAPVPDHALAFDSYTDAELAALAVTQDDLEWSGRALLSSALPGHDVQLAPVIGFGITEDRRQRPPIWHPHGFSLEWMRIAPGSSTGPHRIADSQALLLVEGAWQVTFNRGEESVATAPAEGAVVSAPPDVWRDFANVGSGSALAVVVSATDRRNIIEWDESVIAAAREEGWARDAAAYVAPVHMLGRSQP